MKLVGDSLGDPGKAAAKALPEVEKLRNEVVTQMKDLVNKLKSDNALLQAAERPLDIRKQAYEPYRDRKLLDRDLIYIRRAKDMQWRGVTLIGTGTAVLRRG